MTFETTENKKKLTIHGWWFVLALALWLGLSDKPHARLCSHAALNTFLADVQKRGGSLVRCKEGECEDVRTGAYFGRKPDGFYLIYPDGTIDAQELREQRAILQRLMQDEERQCGVN